MQIASYLVSYRCASTNTMRRVLSRTTLVTISTCRTAAHSSLLEATKESIEVQATAYRDRSTQRYMEIMVAACWSETLATPTNIQVQGRQLKQGHRYDSKGPRNEFAKLLQPPAIPNSTLMKVGVPRLECQGWHHHS